MPSTPDWASAESPRPKREYLTRLTQAVVDAAGIAYPKGRQLIPRWIEAGLSGAGVSSHSTEEIRVADHDKNPSFVAAPRAASRGYPKNAAGPTSFSKKTKGAAEGSSKPRQGSAQGKPKSVEHGEQHWESDDRFTHPLVINAVEESFGLIDFDPCWHPASAVRPVAYLDFRKGQDGLRDPWQGRVALVNPPWSAAKKFLERSYDQWKKGNVQTVICLIPSNTDTTFFHTVLKAEADVYFVMGRMRFFKEDGSPYTSAQAVMIVIFGATEQEKARFEARLPGSWWMPHKNGMRRHGASGSDPARLRAANDPYSCAAPAWLDGYRSVALCSRFASSI